MRINGVDPKTLPQEEVLVIPKGDQNIVFRARGVPDMVEFNALCPEPKPSVRMVAGGVLEPNITEPGYQAAVQEYSKRHLSYLVIKSLEPSKVEWDTVNMDSPGTWCNWEKDFLNNGLLPSDCNRIMALVLEANSLSEAKIKQAREVFLLGQKLASAA
jgi:hypothetical protein